MISGVISQELKNAMMTMGDKPLSAEETDELLRRADIDGDGQINYHAFVKFTMNKPTEGM